MTRTVVLIDGEHYPPVIRAAIDDVEARGGQVVAAVFLGGGEKLAGVVDMGAVPVVAVDGPASWATQRAALERAIAGFSPEVVLDLSDVPIVDEQRRWRLAAVSVARGVPYRAPGLQIDVPHRPRLCAKPSIAVIAAAKRAGKTAVGAHLARVLADRGLTPVVVAMGRGGPAEPTLVRGDVQRPDAAALLDVAASGGHAASDFYEDAVMAGVRTIGARRAGAGPAGAPASDNVAAAVAVANEQEAEMIVLEGSGSAIPPAHADATVLVLRATDDPAQGFGLYRLLLADLVVVTMCEEPTASPRSLSELSTSLNDLAGVQVVKTVFRPIPVEPVRGRTIFYATTAPESVSENIVTYLEETLGARVAGITHNLGDREALRHDLEKASAYDVLLTELKAAAIDTAARIATASGASVMFADNKPVPIEGEPDLDDALAGLAATATRRFAGSDMNGR